MNVNRWVTGWLGVAALVGGQWLRRAGGPPGRAAAGGAGGGGGVSPGGAQGGRRPGPLLALRAGDTIRVSDEAVAVILLSGGRGTVRVTKANSPFLVAASQPGGTKAQKAMTLLEASLGFLSPTAKEEPRATLS